MSNRPVIIAVNAESEALGRISSELRRRYHRDYRVLCEKAPKDALISLEAAHGKGSQVALVLADLACTELLGRVQELYPRAKRGLLIPWGGWGDDETATAIRQAMAYGLVDYYVVEPWTSPEEYFHRTVTELLTEWQRSDPAIRREVTLVSDPGHPRTNELLNLLGRNGVPHGFYQPSSDEGRRLLREVGREDASGPLVILRDGTVLEDPSNTELAARGYRFPTELERFDFDVVVVGAGPAGLTAAVYASSEGFDTLVVEQATIGGQASSSSRIRNYLGFPRGLSGSELAQRAYQQAWVFGTTFLLTREVTALARREVDHVLEISGAEEVRARAVILASGITYRRLDIPALERLAHRGVFYGASPTDAQPYAGKHAVVVGGGNSAGQAAVHLSRYAARVTVVVRGMTLAASMSRYLRDEMGTRENIHVLHGAEVVDAYGDTWLEQIVVRESDGETAALPAHGLFILIGGIPHTDWLPPEVQRDDGGYVVTDENLDEARRLERPPLMYETSSPGVFAVGDARSRSVKRVAAAVGEGSAAIQNVHRYFETDRAVTHAGTR